MSGYYVRNGIQADTDLAPRNKFQSGLRVLDIKSVPRRVLGLLVSAFLMLHNFLVYGCHIACTDRPVEVADFDTGRCSSGQRILIGRRVDTVDGISFRWG